MRRSMATVAVVAATILAALLPNAVAAEERAPSMSATGRTAQPIGHHEFCQVYPDECAVISPSRVHVRLDQTRWNELNAVNRTVNTSIRPATDDEIFGRPEVWEFPEDRGDCEDFVLLKRRQLMERGWPAAALLITVVRQTNGDGHAVLTVTTNRGDLILDNLDPHVKLWTETPYRYLKRQSEYDSGAWVSIEDGRGQPQVGSLR